MAKWLVHWFRMEQSRFEPCVTGSMCFALGEDSVDLHAEGGRGVAIISLVT